MWSPCSIDGGTLVLLNLFLLAGLFTIAQAQYNCEANKAMPAAYW